VYIGNFPGKGENTYCHSCGELLIERKGYLVIKNKLSESKCSYCGAHIDGVF
jgi:pyruvate formate lyase activating enzyme